MKNVRSIPAMAAAAALAVAALGASGVASAQSVYWSVGVSSPGVQLGVTHAQPVYVQPQTVYVQPQPVYLQPRPIYVHPQPVVYLPAPPQPVVVYPGWRPGRGPHWRHHHGDDRRGWRDDGRR